MAFLDYIARNWFNQIVGLLALLLLAAFIYTELAQIPRSQEFNIMVVGTWTFFFGAQAGVRQTLRNGKSGS